MGARARRGRVGGVLLVGGIVAVLASAAVAVAAVLPKPEKAFTTPAGRATTLP
jgi:uncharacterized membrane protein